MSTVAVFGGSFNPPHIAHVLAVATVLTTEEVDTLLVVPTFKHPFGKPLAPYEDRVTMCRLAMAWMPHVEVSRIEEHIGGASLTLRTLEHLQRENPTWKLRLIMGADLLLEAHKWFRFEDVARLAPPIVLGRAGITHPRAPHPVLPEVSSTMVRSRIAEGTWEELHGIVPRKVLAHIRERGLYASSPQPA